MSNTKKKTSKGLLGFYITSGILTVLDLIFFFVFGFLTEGVGDAEISGVGSVISYHLTGIGKLFAFAYGNPEDLGSFALSVLLYAFIICYVIFLVAAAIVAKTKHRRIMWWAVAIVTIDLLGYMVFASGTEKYFQIINSESPFGGKPGLVFVTFGLIILGIIHFVCSMVSYFWSIVEAYKNPGLVDEKEEKRAKQGEYSAIETNSYGEKTHRNAPERAKTAKRAYIIQNFYECRHKGCKKKKA